MKVKFSAVGPPDNCIWHCTLCDKQFGKVKFRRKELRAMEKHAKDTHKGEAVFR